MIVVGMALAADHGDAQGDGFVVSDHTQLPLLRKLSESFLNRFAVTICCRGLVWRTATIGDVMQTLQTFQTTDLKVASRCRYAQYRGLPATLRVKGLLVTGLVRSLKEDRSSNPVRWIITVVVAKRSAAA
jgi:uncharacterized protein (DUF2249 family)